MDEDTAPAVVVNEGDPPPSPEVVEQLADAAEHADDAAIDIARIEAEARVDIAEAEAGAAVEIAEAQAEAIVETSGFERRIAELETWREAHGPADHPAIWAAIADLTTMLQSILPVSTPPPTPEPFPENSPGEASEAESDAGEPGLTSSEQPQESVSEKPRSAAKGVRWI